MHNYYDFKEYEEYYRTRDMKSDRVILHSDLNNFFASVESASEESLKCVPLAICGDEEARHGIVLAKNELAKRFGIRTGDTVREAKRKCPSLVTRSTQYGEYVKLSRKVREIYLAYATRVEPFGIDEAWIDVSDLAHRWDSSIFRAGEDIAGEIKTIVKKEFGLTVSIGVSFNKTLAKLASDMKKPDAITVLPYGRFADIISRLPVEDLIYVGRSTKEEFERLKIRTIGDLASQRRSDMLKEFGKNGGTMWDRANGYDLSPVENYHKEVQTLSISNSTTTPKDVTTAEMAFSVLMPLTEAVTEELRGRNQTASTVRLYVRYSDLSSLTRQSAIISSDRTEEIFRHVKELYLDNVDISRPIRTLGMGVEGLADKKAKQQDIFTSNPVLDEVIDSLRQKYGDAVIKRGSVMKEHEISSFDKKHVAFNTNI